MAGISSFGVYLPKYRMVRDVMDRAWGPGFISGDRVWPTMTKIARPWLLKQL